MRREEVLPAYRALGWAYEQAITQGQIADVLFVKGDLDEAMRLQSQEALPVFQRLDDVHWVAITKAKDCRHFGRPRRAR